MGVVLHRRVATLFAITLFLVHGAGAQTDSFVWGFYTFKDTSLPECAKLRIFVAPGPKTQPPYTLIAYEANGISTVQTLGSDLNDLWWNVDHAAGAQLVLSMTDAASNPGGVARDLFNVVSGENTSCHPQNPTSSVSITTNTTRTLKTCDILPLKVTGGQKPYTITLATLDTVSVMNVSMGVYDRYNWINRAPPNSRLIATVSDATGTYAAGTALISTTGISDLTCDGRQSTLLDTTGKLSASQSGTAVVAKATASQSSSSAPNSISLAKIIGAAAAGITLLGALVVGFVFCLRRKKSSHSGPQQYADGGSRQAIGLGKVGDAAARGEYQEITSFRGRAESTPYGDYYSRQYNQGLDRQGPPVQGYYNQGSYSSGAATLVGSSAYLDQHGQFAFAEQLPSEAALATPVSFSAVSPPPSAPAHDPYANVAPKASTVSTYSASTSAAPESASDNFTGPVAGTSQSTGVLAFTNASRSEAQGVDVKGGAVPPSQPRESVYQHDDIEDIVELPPAYKERPA